MPSLKDELTKAFYGRGTVSPAVTAAKADPKTEYIAKIRAMGYEMEYLEPALKVLGNHLIVSGAGAGKTTLLTMKVGLDVATGELTRIKEVNGKKLIVLEKIWVCTFLKSGADELKTSFRDWNRKMGAIDTSSHITFSTLHAEFKRALSEYGRSTAIVESKDERRIFDSIVKKYQLTSEDGNALSWDEAGDLKTAFTYTRNRVDETRYSPEIYEQLGLSPEVIDSILQEMRTSRLALSVMDFEDLQEEMYRMLVLEPDKEFIDFISGRYKYLYIDEFQDTAQIQYEILKFYGLRATLGVGKVTAIGDDDQTIYSWRGSDHRIITSRFAEDFTPAVSSIGKNYRCPSNILNPIIPSIENNSPRLEKALESSKEGGVFRIGRYPNYSAMGQALPAKVYEDISNGLSVAILCRTNKDGVLPALMIDRDGRASYSVSSDGMTLSSSYGKRVMGICSILTDKSSPKVEAALKSLTFNKREVAMLMRKCKAEKKFFWQLDADDLRYSCPSIFEFLSMVHDRVTRLGRVEALKSVLGWYRVRVYTSNMQYSEMMRSLLDVFSLYLRSEEWESVSDFLEEMESVGDRMHGRIKQKNVDVTIATVHEYKGKEADSVYIWNDSTDVFPNGNVSSDNEFQEERRVHYIACTRARKISTIMTLADREGDFLKEMDLDSAERLSVEVAAESVPRPKAGVAAVARLGSKIYQEARASLEDDLRQ